MPRNAQRWLSFAGVVALLALASALRFAPISAALPYTDYIDEGYALHQVLDQLNTGSAHCQWYGYPTLTSFLVNGAARATAPFSGHAHGHRFHADLPTWRERYLPLGLNYNLVAPAELILVGRIVVALLGIATVVVAGLLAWELGGAACGWLALLFTAVCPALVTRSSNIIVDTTATLFVLVSLCFAARLLARAHIPSAVLWRWAACAGGAAGLALSSKYTAGAVFAAVLATLATLPRPLTEKIRLGAIAGFAFVIAALCANPAFVQHPQVIAHDMGQTTALYKTLRAGPNYWVAALGSDELGLPLVVAGLAGIGLMLWRRSTRVIAMGWGVFAVVLLTPLIRLTFQPFRNVLPLVPLLCIAAALLFSAAAAAFAGRERFRTLRYVAPVVALLIALGAFVASIGEIRERLARVDTRVRAVDWLAAHTSERHSVLAIGELVVLPAEWERLKARVTVVPWVEALAALERERFDYVIGSEMNIEGTIEPHWASHLDAWNRTAAALPVVASFGQVPCPVYPYLWRTNDLRVIVWKRGEITRSAPALSTARRSVDSVRLPMNLPNTRSTAVSKELP